eukprot:TRINITY_DN3790_c0_g1_i1.p1 TRINITY_DN3790_c0_g1~~TRINITY_DN3790_c0_g1_i1.p1  ORF type:complete len:669 (+),score=162.85 TRINITY_DN3790_c0_g1_i1:211-2217(+)
MGMGMTSPEGKRSDGYSSKNSRQQLQMRDASPDMSQGKTSKLSKQAGLLQEYHAPPPPLKCTKCEETKANFDETKKKFFTEIEHLRRGLKKLIETVRPFMPAANLRRLMEELQLDVRYLTTPEPGEGGPIPQVAAEDDPLVKNLRRRIAELEAIVHDQKHEIRDLENELRKAYELLAKAGIQAEVPASRGRGKAGARPEAKEIQTDPWHPGKRETEVVETGYAEAGTRERKAKEAREKEEKGPRKKKAPGEPEDSSDEEEVVDPVTGKKKFVRRAEKESESKPGRTVIHQDGIDPKEYERLKAELELLKMKLKAAERQLEELEALKKENAELKRRLAEQEKLIAELQAKIAELEGRPQGEGGVRYLVQKGDSAQPEAVEGKKKKKADAKEEGGGRSGGGGLTSKERAKFGGPVQMKEGKKATIPKEQKEAEKAAKKAEAEARGEVYESESSEEEEESSESEASVVMVDACVGNGPGRGMADEPIRIRGRNPQQPEELNSTGRIFDRHLTKQPDLFGGSGGLSNTLPHSEIMARTVPGGLRCRSRGATAFSGGAATTGVSLAASSPATWSSKSTPDFHSLRKGSKTWQEAEPYLMQVWDQKPTSFNKPVKRELMRLGALSPVTTLRRGADLSGLVSPTLDGSPLPSNMERTLTVHRELISSPKHDVGCG